MGGFGGVDDLKKGWNPKTPSEWICNNRTWIDVIIILVIGLVYFMKIEEMENKKVLRKFIFYMVVVAYNILDIGGSL